MSIYLRGYEVFCYKLVPNLANAVTFWENHVFVNLDVPWKFVVLITDKDTYICLVDMINATSTLVNLILRWRQII